jgi:metal-sulfur cluster biosynthetic enzyme
MKDIGHQKMIDRQHYEDTYPKLTESLHTVYDPEIPVDVFELGLIYDVQINEDNSADVVMTLTSPSCPVAEQLPQWVQEAVVNAGYSPVRMQLTFEPPWVMDFMSDDARLILGM